MTTKNQEQQHTKQKSILMTQHGRYTYEFTGLVRAYEGLCKFKTWNSISGVPMVKVSAFVLELHVNPLSPFREIRFSLRM